MSFRRLEKSFDDPEARRPRVSIADLWSAEAWFFVGPPTDTHPEIARRFDREGLSPVLDIGCGTGALGRCLEGRWFGVDISIEQLREAEGPRALAEATRLPFPDSSFAGAAALYVLYFFEDPAVVVAEARRVLRPGGLFAACAPSRYDAPELAHVAPSEEEFFMAEDIPGILEEFYDDIELTTWDAPMFDLPDRDAVRDYLYSWYYPALTYEEAERRAAAVEVPLKLTKRGAWGVGRKPVRS